jgi:hypothetical protein
LIIILFSFSIWVATFTTVVCLSQPFAESSPSADYQLSRLSSVRRFLQVLCQHFVFDYVSSPFGEVILLRICVKDVGLVRHSAEGIPKFFHVSQNFAVTASKYVFLWHIGQDSFSLLFQFFCHILYSSSFSLDELDKPEYARKAFARLIYGLLNPNDTTCCLLPHGVLPENKRRL